MTDKDYAPLSSICSRALCDKVYDKRKVAALEVEKMVKQFNEANNVNQIRRLLRVLGQDFANAHSVNQRNGGLIGLSSAAIGLGKDSVAYLPELINPVIACFSDADFKVRYHACEALYNIVKIVRGAMLPYFPDIFHALSKLATDTDIQTKNATELLDRLIKDIVTETDTFDLDIFIPLLRERIYTRNSFGRQFIISWVSVLDAVPEIDLTIYLPEILDGMFKFLEDPMIEIKKMCDTQLCEFMRSIKKDPSRIDFASMINILIIHAQSTDEMLQFTAITWIKEFVQLSGITMLPYLSGIFTAVLPCLSYNGDSRRNIKETASAVNFSLMKLITLNPEDAKIRGMSDEDKGVHEYLDVPSVVEVLSQHLLHSSVQTKVAVLKWILHLYDKIPNKMFGHTEQLFSGLLRSLSDNADDVVRQSLAVLAEICSLQATPTAAVEDEVRSPYYRKFLVALLQLLAGHVSLLEDRGAFIVRQLCVLLNAEDIYRTLSEILLEEKNLDFASTMVDTLNTILLTSAELYDLRCQLKQFNTPLNGRFKQSGLNNFNHDMANVDQGCRKHFSKAKLFDVTVKNVSVLGYLNMNCHYCVFQASRSLFVCLYECWSHSPVPLAAICLLTHNYQHCNHLIKLFGDLEITVDFLTEIDKLVQLIESPIFAYLRLELLGNDADALRGALYGLLMLLPQTEAFHTLRRRLQCAPSDFSRQPDSIKITNEKNTEEEIPFDRLLKHFVSVQAAHRTYKLSSRTKSMFLADSEYT